MTQKLDMLPKFVWELKTRAQGKGVGLLKYTPLITGKATVVPTVECRRMLRMDWG